MEGDTTLFDYRIQAELARKAQRDFKIFIESASRKVHATPNRETLHQWGEFQKTPAYKYFLNAYLVAVDAACPSGFDDDFEKLHSHSDMKALETAVVFLEADPYFFRSGYIKEKLLRYMRGYHLSPKYVARLQRVILNVVDSHYCREFCEYRKLAHRIDNADLRLELQNRTSSEDRHVRSRAQWVLDWLEGLRKTV
jgi:hypothetical protein